jgi:hypothetical protein
MNKLGLIKLAATASMAALLVTSAQAQTLLYSLNGVGGTGGGTTGISATPGTAPSGSSTLGLIAGPADYNFGAGVNGAAGESIVNSGTYGGAAGLLGGTVANLGTLSQMTLTMWINPSVSPAGNNTRLLDISSGSPTTGSADGNELFFGINAGGGLQFYVNNVNGNSVGTSITTPTVFNGGLAQVGTWYFLAVTYDSVAGNYLLYTGTTANSANLAYTFGGISPTGVAFASTSALLLANRPNQARAFDGSIDDVNIYDGALNVSQLQALQNAQMTPTPEPGTLALVGIGFAGLAMMRRRWSLKKQIQ